MEDEEWTDIFDRFLSADFVTRQPLIETRLSRRVQRSRRAANLATYSDGRQARIDGRPIWANPHVGDASTLWASGWRSPGPTASEGRDLKR